MRHIVVGVDGSRQSVQALAWSAALARPMNAEIIAVNAYRPVQSEMRPGYFERLKQEQAHRLEGWCSDVLAGVRHQLEVVDGDPRAGLLAAAGRHHADLLVVATTGSSGKSHGFLHLGSVAEYLAHHAGVALALVPDSASAHVERVVVAVDGSEHSQAAERWLATIAAVIPMSIVAVGVAEPGFPDMVTEQDVRGDWTTSLSEKEIAFEPIIARETPAADGILRAATDHDADLVVLGMRGAGGFSELRLGGVAFKVIHRAGMPVVLVPPDDADR